MAQENPNPTRPKHESGRAHAADQPFDYPLRREYLEPDWTRLPGFRDVTRQEWESAQWQRAHTVKNLTEFKRALGEHLTDDLYGDIERDQQERATMSMLLPPQMVNTMDETDLRADPVRRYMAPAFADREQEFPSPPDGLTRLPARGRHVGGRGTHAPLSDEGPRRAHPHVPAVLRALHADGPRRQRHAADPQVQVRDEAERALGRDARLPAANPVRPRRRRVWWRHGERADQAPAGLAPRAHGHRERPGHPDRDEGPDGHPAALPPGRGARRLRRDRQARARTRASRSRSTRT